MAFLWQCIFLKMCTSLWIIEFLNFYPLSNILNRTLRFWSFVMLHCVAELTDPSASTDHSALSSRIVESQNKQMKMTALLSFKQLESVNNAVLHNIQEAKKPQHQ
jgi:hypothetical protein